MVATATSAARRRYALSFTFIALALVLSSPVSTSASASASGLNRKSKGSSDERSKRGADDSVSGFSITRESDESGERGKSGENSRSSSSGGGVGGMRSGSSSSSSNSGGDGGSSSRSTRSSISSESSGTSSRSTNNGRRRRLKKPFCSSVLRLLTSCPKPSVQNRLDLKNFMGRWYEVGSSAQFKLQPSNGLGSACVTTDFSATGKVKGYETIKMVSTGLTTVDEERQGQAQAISNAALAIGIGVRNLCTLAYGDSSSPSPSSSSSLAMLLVSLDSAVKRSQLGTAAKFAARVAMRAIRRQIRRMEQSAAVVFGLVEKIQLRNGALSQQSKPKNWRAVKGLMATMAGNVVRAAERVADSSKTIGRFANVIVALGVKGNDKTVASLAKVISAKGGPKGFTAIVVAILTRSAKAISATSQAIAASADEEKDVETLVSKAIQDPKEPAKLSLTSEEDLGRQSMPYWIVQLKGEAADGYDLAVAFSCKILPVPSVLGNVSMTTVQVLSRKPSVEWWMVRNTLRDASRQGIWLGGDNPFIVERQEKKLCKGLWSLP